jgi:hypothetical protein
MIVVVAHLIDIELYLMLGCFRWWREKSLKCGKAVGTICLDAFQAP